MGLLANFNISGSAISAQSTRLNTIASNLANVETIAGSEADGGLDEHAEAENGGQHNRRDRRSHAPRRRPFAREQ